MGIRFQDSGSRWMQSRDYLDICKDEPRRSLTVVHIIALSVVLIELLALALLPLVSQ